MKDAGKMMISWGVGTTVGLYTTFVLQAFWNWFVVGAINVGPIAYWQMFGMNSLIQMLRERVTIEEEDHWNRALTMLLACIPTEKRVEIEEFLKGETEGVWWRVGTAIVGKVVGNTFALGIGWGVHTFLM